MTTRRRSTPTVTLRDFDIHERLCFLTGWTPPELPFDRARSRWQTWAAYLADYAQIRDELLEHHADRLNGRLPFAEQVKVIAEYEGLDALDEMAYADINECGPQDGPDDPDDAA